MIFFRCPNTSAHYSIQYSISELSQVNSQEKYLKLIKLSNKIKKKMLRKLVLHSLNFENLTMKGCSSSITPEEHLLYIPSDLSRFLYLPVSILTLKVQIKTAADNSLEYFFIVFLIK